MGCWEYAVTVWRDFLLARESGGWEEFLAGGVRRCTDTRARWRRSGAADPTHRTGRITQAAIRPRTAAGRKWWSFWTANTRKTRTKWSGSGTTNSGPRRT